MSFSSSRVNDSESSMFSANSTLTGDSSFDMSGGSLTDITGDKSFLIDLTQQSKMEGKQSGAGRDDLLFGALANRSKSTPLKTADPKDVLIDVGEDTESFINKEKGGGEMKSDTESHVVEKNQRSNSDDSLMMVVTEESLNSGEQSDVDTSLEDESDSFNEKKKDAATQPLVNPSTSNMRIANIDDNLPPTVTLLKTPDGAKVYIVGTAHFSEESQNDVSKVIQSVQPHIVLVELCSQRINILQLDEKTILEEAKNIDFEKIRATVKQNGLFNGLIYILLLNMSAHITKQLGMAPGGEFRKALQEVKNIPHCILHLGDRPIQVTMHRALSALSWWQTIRLVWHLINTKDISKEEVEKCKQKDLLSEMMAEMAGDFPTLQRVFVKERDTYLTYSLQVAAASKTNNGPMKVVGVVGIGHVQGILDNWGKVHAREIPPIMSIPPPSMSSKIIRISFKVAFVGLIIYTGYKIIPRKWIPGG